MDWLEYEKKLISNGFRSVCGVDEAGRGPLAGPVCAAAVILPENTIIDSVNDSKKLSEKKREQLFEVIKARSLSYSVAWASIEEIESINILNAAMLAMKRAVEDLSIKADFALIDGNKVPDLDIPAFPVVKGDSLSMSIACASILAKVSRDRLMYKYDEKYPEYGFAKHKGYGTKLHTQVLREIGPCEIHRPSFLKKILGEKNAQT